MSETPRPARQHRPPALLTVAVAAVAAIALSAAAPAPPEPAPSATPVAGSLAPGERISFAAADLTPEGGDRYRYEVEGGSMLVVASDSNHGGNLRSVWWSSASPATVDQQACSTWTEAGGPLAQAGIALRVRRGPGRVDAITVTNNIWSGARSGWNLHVWRGAASVQLVGQVVLADAFGRSVFEQPPLPWRICARVVGSTVEFKAWSTAVEDREPSWGDPVHGAAFLLPPGTDRTGRAGWYIGHLRRGERSGFTALRAEALAADTGLPLSMTVRAVAGCVARTAAGEADPGADAPAPGCGVGGSWADFPA